MKRLVFILMMAGIACISHAQQFTVAMEVDSFGVDIRNNLRRSSSEKAMVTGENMYALWPLLSAKNKQTIMDQVSTMMEKNYSVNPIYVNYFAVIDLARNKSLVDETTLRQLLEMTGKVIELHSYDELKGYLIVLSNFFQREALYYSKNNQLFYNNGEYSFNYYAMSDAPQDFAMDSVIYEDEAPDPYEEDPYADDYDENYDDYDDDYYDDEYYDDYEDDYDEEPEEIEEIIYPDEPLPLQGPVITFSNVNLDIFSTRNHVSIFGTKGSFLIFQQTFTGDGGALGWTPGGLEEKAKVNLQTYNFDLRRPVLGAKAVTLSYPDKLKEPIDGEFEYNGEAGMTGMKFLSYKSDINHSNQGVQGLTLTGGFSLIGDRISTRSRLNSPAILSLSQSGINKFKALGSEFIINDSLISGRGNRTVVYHGRDSIYHPSAEVRFNSSSNQLTVKSLEGNYRYAPFFSSFVNMEITADVLEWNVNSDTLLLSILSGTTELPSLIQSVEYYNPEVLSSFSKNYSFNPIMLATTYVSKTHIREFFPADIAEYNNLNAVEVGRAMADLARNGFLEYDKFTRLYSLRKKSTHYSMSKRGKVDFDNLLLLSKVDSGPNVIFDMKNNEMSVNGIEKFYISEVLDVYIEPDSNRIVLGKDREFTFNGKLLAGNFEYDGSGFRFNYDSFFFDLTQIDQIQLYTQGDDSQKSKISNVISGISDADSSVVSGISDFQGTSGKLFVNRSNNKSGRKIYPNYPKFEGGGSGFVVYFNGKEYLDGIYGKTMHMVVPPFNLDSLSDSDPTAINFRGKFNSNDIMPEFSEMLHIMPDRSLGFEHSVPPEGYPLFEGDSRIFNKISMDKTGLRSQGEMTYMTSSFYSDSYVYYPDSIVADASNFIMKPEAYKDLVFPDIKADHYKMTWLTTVDSMHLDNINLPFSLYEGIATLDGRTTITHNGVFGEGNMISLGSETISKQYQFKSDRFLAGHAEFKINSIDPEKPALAGDDVRLDFDLVTKKATISPEVQGEAALEFPYAQFKTSIPTAVWDLDSGIVTMNKPERVDIESSYFYTTREDLDSLRFNATKATYNMNSQELQVSGIPYITVADAEITPENGEVLILANSRIGTLENTTIVIDTLNGYHRLYDGTIDIISRNEFSGSATYEFINAVQDTFAIKLEDFHLEQIGDGKRKGNFEQQTVATGTVNDDDQLVVSPGIFYKGSIIMSARKPALELDGFVKLDLKKIPGYDTWIQYASEAEQQEVILDFNSGQTEYGGNLVAGLHFDYNDYSLYHTFISDKREIGDEDFFVPSGRLRFFPDSSEYVIVDEARETGNTYEGKMMVYNEDSNYVYLEGPVSLLEPSKDVAIAGAVIGRGNTESLEYSFDAMLTLDFAVNPGVFDIMAEGFLQAIDLLGPPEAIGDRTSLLYNLANLIGDRAAKDYEQLSIEAYTPLLSMSTQLVKPITIAEVDLKWSDDQKAFYNDNGTMGFSNVLRTDINSSFESFLEIRKGVDGDKVDLFIKASPDFWYYFSYQDNKMLIYSSDESLNELVRQKTNQGKAKISEFVFAPGDIGETQTYVNTFRRIYYGIKEPYDLGGEVKQETEEKKKVTDDDDDEGF